MEKIKVAFLDFWPEINDENIFLLILKKYFDVEVTTTNPDVVIHSIFQGAGESTKYKCKKILYCGENKRPGVYGSNYSISFDPHSETNFQLPLWQYYMILNEDYKDRFFNRLYLDSFERFCSFTVSNPNNFVRNGMFNQLKSYKPVSSYGRYMNNDYGLQEASRGKYWRKAKDEFFLKHSHKFSIAYENNSYPHYTTEKLMDAFLVGSMPIYWGDPKVKENFNEKAFINVIDYGSDIMKVIQMMDSNDQAFEEKYHEPVFTNTQWNKHVNNLMEFETWFIKVIKK